MKKWKYIDHVLRRTNDQFQPCIKHSFVKDSNFFKRRAMRENCKNLMGLSKKIFFFRIKGLISNNTSKKHPWIKGNQVFYKKGPFYSQKVDNDIVLFNEDLV